MQNNKACKNYNSRALAGQKMLVGFDGTDFNSDLEFLISELKVAGIILFSKNIETPEQLTKLIANIKQFAKKSSIPDLIIAVDQEGGEVARLKKPFKEFQGNPFLNSMKDVEKFGKDQSAQLKKYGINMNFAPVLDVVPETYESIMANRAFKGDAAKVGKLGSFLIETMQESSIMAVAKHFPGIGRTKIDSHFEMPVVQRTIIDLKSEELIPFAASIRSNVTGIMLSHILYPELDRNWQASLSPYIVKNLLRDKMNYDGLVMTDDLDMKSITIDIKTCAEQILISDIDLALICHKGPDIESMFDCLKQLIEQNEKYHRTAEHSFNRIIKVKEKYIKN